MGYGLRRTDRLGHVLALRRHHINLPQLGDNLGIAVLLRAKNYKLGWTTSAGIDQGRQMQPVHSFRSVLGND